MEPMLSGRVSPDCIHVHVVGPLDEDMIRFMPITNRIGDMKRRVFTNHSEQILLSFKTTFFHN